MASPANSQASPRPINSKGVGASSCVGIRLPGASDAHWSVRTTLTLKPNSVRSAAQEHCVKKGAAAHSEL